MPDRRAVADPEGALHALEKAFEADPSNAAALDALARIHTEARRFDVLRALLETARAQSTGRRAIDLDLALGDLLVEQTEDVEAARAAYQSALAADPAETRALQGLERLALQSGDDEAVIEAFEREAAVTTDRGRLAFLVWELVRLRERKEEPEEALLWIERLAQVAPDDRRVLECCARLQEQLGHDEELAQTLDQLDRQLAGGERATNRRRIADLYAKLGDAERSAAAYRAALEADPEDLAALRALLRILERSGDLAELAEAHGRLAALTTGDERRDSLGVRAEVLEALGQPHDALAVIERIAAEFGPMPEQMALHERLLEATARYEDLAALLAAKREALPADSHAAAGLELRRAELVRERLGRPAEAIRLYRAALAGRHADEDRERALDGFESALRESGDREGLAELLATRAAACTEPVRAAELELERAELLEEADRTADAR